MIMKRFYTLFIGGLFIITACVQPASNIGTDQSDTSGADTSMSQQDGTADSDTMTEGGDSVDSSDDQMQNDSTASAAPGMTTFTNKAANYEVTYPDTWYWRHYIASEIPGQTIIDYFAADPDVAPSLSNEYLGRFVVEVSNRPVADLVADIQDDLVNTNQRTANVDGHSATRITGKFFAGDIEGFTTVQYIFSQFNRTHRVMMIAFEPTSAEIADFDTFVGSLTFVN